MGSFVHLEAPVVVAGDTSWPRFRTDQIADSTAFPMQPARSRGRLRAICDRCASDIAIDGPVVFFDAEPVAAYDWAGGTPRPEWAEEPGPSPINARTETAATSGMFHSSFTSQRCLVPMTGYYEWETSASGKQPHYIHGPWPLAAAGLFADLEADASDWVLVYTPITREARDVSGEVQDRMPTFLLPDLWDCWLFPD